MNIAQYLHKSGITQSEFARSIGTTQPFVWQWTKGLRPVPVEWCADIERVTNGAVTRRDLRPDDWKRIWPELAAPTQGSAQEAEHA